MNPVKGDREIRNLLKLRESNYMYLFPFLGDLIPHYYYVPKLYIQAEKNEPHSQVRLPSDEEGNLFLWGQSLLVIVELLGER